MQGKGVIDLVSLVEVKHKMKWIATEWEWHWCISE